MAKSKTPSKPKPGTVGAAEWVLKTSYGLRLESIRADAGRLYTVHSAEGYKLSDSMPASELRAWVRGYIVAREGRPSVYV